MRSVTFSECPEAYVPKAGVTVESGHSYQYGERICDYYLGALELPKPSDPKK